MMRLGPRGPAAQLAPNPDADINLMAFDQVVALIRAKRDIKLLTEVENHLRLVRYAPGRIEFEPAPGAAPDLAARLGQRLQGWTGQRWGVSIASGGAATIAETRSTADMTARAEMLDNPLVAAVMAAFPGATITEIRDPIAPSAAPITDDPGDDWDPFEEE